MTEFDLAIRGGTVCTTANTTRCDIGIRDGRIVAIAEKINDAAREIDASGLLVLPGGIDAHVHISQPAGDGIVMADDFMSATRSAVAGGTTTVMPFALQQKGDSLRTVVEDYHRQAEGNLFSDVSFHLIVTDPTPQVLGQELPALVKDGYTSFKVFMTYDDMMLSDGELLDVFDVAKHENALVMVHAEGHDAIRYLTRKLEERGQTQPYYHGISRPQIVEREATHRAISHAELIDLPIVIVHVSGSEAMEQIQWARNRGRTVFAETCPQYIVLTQDDMRGLNMDFEGAKYVCSPPPRNHESQEAIWRGIKDGTFDIFSSDHSPFRYADRQGKDRPGARTSFKWIPNGIPGIETRLPILFSEGVSKGRISLERFVALTSTNPAKLYGLAPRKGSIAIGADADITLWDANKKVTISQSLLHHGSDYTPYEGMAVTGWPVLTMLRGKTVTNDGNVVGDPGFGTHLFRAPSTDRIR
jgi:dihydropyrimidinase